MRFSIFPAILLCFLLVGPVWAGDPATPQTKICIKDSKACRMLAVEVTKLNFSDLITQKLGSRQGNNFLCPADNPQCCPPHLMPLCSKVNKDFIFETRRENLNGWNSFLCEAGGGRWNELLGTCKPDDFIIGVYDPPRPPFGNNCDTCSETINKKGKCVPKKSCLFRGTMLPCDFVCRKAPDAEKFKMVESNPSILSRHMTDTKVQIEAARQVQKDLKISMRILDAEIKKLSDPNYKK
jgi:hypothetical protein